MTAQDATMSHPPLDAEAVARINALPQADQPAKSTVIQDGNRTVRITTDQHGNTRIERTGPSAATLENVPPVPAIPQTPLLQPFPGATVVEPSLNDMIPRRAVDMAYGFYVMCAVIIVGWPIARAFGRRIERSANTPALPPATADQLRRIEQAVEAMSIEVERISESQRFMAKIQSGSTAERV